MPETLPDWMQEVFPRDNSLPVRVLLARLLVALALGCVVGAIYRLTHGRGRGAYGRGGDGVLATLVLLTVLIAMVTLVIGNSVARAFSLVGALAIVRFRTVVEDTRDTAFVIFAVTVGMAIGAGFLEVPLIGLPIAAFAAFLFRPRPAPAVAGPATYLLTVRLGVGYLPHDVFREPFAKHLLKRELTATATARQGTAVELTYAVTLRDPVDGPLSLVAELNGREGVQNVELRRPTP